jgi:hypothetical protein
MRKSIVEGDDFSVLPPYAVRLGRALRSIVERLTGKRDEQASGQRDDAEQGEA